MDPAAQIALEFLKAVADATPTLYRIFSQMGGRDGFLAALDATLATARAKTDTDLVHKHR